MPKQYHGTNASLTKMVGARAIAVLYAIGLVGCTASPQGSNGINSSELLRVVATHSVLCDMTKAIAQETIELTCLMQPGVDPHSYRVTPEDRKSIETAQVIFYGGYNFEPELIKIINTNKNANKIAVHEVAVPQPIMAEAHHHDHHTDEQESHSDQTAPDPHVWHNVQNGIRMVETIREELTTLAPTHFNTYAANSQQLSEQLQELDKWIKAQINTIPPKQRKLVTTHDALTYYANAYGLTIEGVLQGVSADEKPTAGRVKQLVQEVKKASVPTIFPEVSSSDKVIQTVAKEAGVKVAKQPLYVDTLGKVDTPAKTYIGMLKTNTCTIVQGLEGQCQNYQ